MPTGRTHALIIGVNDYPYLLNGEHYSPLQDLPPLSQLTSPYYSAMHFSEWCLKDFNNPSAPLESIELLVSDPKSKEQKINALGNVNINGEAVNISISAPTMVEIQAACRRWFDRCNSNENNIPIFYFCGHGLSIGLNQLLLAEDFGKNHADAMENSINFWLFSNGMGKCKAKTQLYFLDACRERSYTLPDIGEPGQKLISARASELRPRNWPVFYSTLDGTQAFGEDNKPSYFTDALVRCLRGLGSDEDENDNWIVSSNSIMPALVNTMKPYQQEPIRGGEDRELPFHFLKSKPSINIGIGCHPSLANNHAHFWLKDETDTLIAERKPPINAEWSTLVYPGNYTVGAKFDGSTYISASEKLKVRPPRVLPTKKYLKVI